MDLSEIFGEPIHCYTRAQALADGVLVEVPATVAREAGFRYPVALTAAAWTQCVEVPRGLEGEQDEAGRLWDVLWMLRCAVRGSGVVGSDSASSGGELQFQLYVRTQRGRNLGPRDLVTLKSVCGPGDAGEPVLTIMLPEED